MRAALYQPPPNETDHASWNAAPRPPSCAGVPRASLENWHNELPAEWQAQVVAPVRFEIAQEHDVLADRVDGWDAAQQPCYLAQRYVLTELRTDDDESFYEAPVYIETLTAWRLQDNRWLHLHQTISDCDRGVARRSLSLSHARPR